tara:strand:- start:470 stop:637 length:168 start_codon:yes stop_codon:yes gene_type:complete
LELGTTSLPNISVILISFLFALLSSSTNVVEATVIIEKVESNKQPSFVKADNEIV